MLPPRVVPIPPARSATFSTGEGTGTLRLPRQPAAKTERGTITKHRTRVDPQHAQKRSTHQEAEPPGQAPSECLRDRPSQQLLDEDLEQATRRARSGPAGALLVLHVSDLNQVNDTLGRSAGEQALLIVRQRLQSALRADDLLVRVDGDEFAVVLQEITLKEAKSVAERLVQAIRGFCFEVDGQLFDLALRVGIAPIDGSLDTPAVLARGFAALSHAKERGPQPRGGLQAQGSVGGHARPTAPICHTGRR